MVKYIALQLKKSLIPSTLLVLSFFYKGHVSIEGVWKDGLMDGEMNLTTQV
jgi:hypothetical protein